MVVSVVSIGAGMEDDWSLIFPLGQGDFYLSVLDDVDSPQAMLHIVFGGAHGVVVVEEHAWQLVVGGLYHLGGADEAAPEDHWSRVAGRHIEGVKVVLFAHLAEVARAVFSLRREPGERVPVVGCSHFEPVNMGGDRDRLFWYDKLPICPDGGSRVIIRAVVRLILGFHAGWAGRIFLIAVYCLPLHVFRDDDVVDPDDVDFFVAVDQEHRAGYWADHLGISTVALVPGSGKATVLQQGMLNNRIIICTHDDCVSGGLGIGVEWDAVGIAQEGSEHFEIIHCLDWAVYVLIVLRRWRGN